MSKLQSIVLALGLGLFCLLYFGFSTKPRKIANLEGKRVIETQVTDVNNLIKAVQNDLTPEQAAYLIALEREIEASELESNKIELLKRLSGKWFEYQQPHIAGFYAEKVAEIENTVQAWSIAGTTYAATFQGEREKKVKDYALSKAIGAFENAISLDPSNLQSKVNLGLCYVEYPPAENPMKGILMLVELNKKYPDEPIVLNNLGRLAIRTGQFERAVQRLERVLEIEPANQNAICLLAQAFKGLGEIEKSDFYLNKCNQ